MLMDWLQLRINSCSNRKFCGHIQPHLSLHPYSAQYQYRNAARKPQNLQQSLDYQYRFCRANDEKPCRTSDGINSLLSVNQTMKLIIAALQLLRNNTPLFSLASFRIIFSGFIRIFFRQLDQRI
ncbi:MAG: hypothetical protein CMI09_14940 [Oceanospirillaceae bacterium]|nr:hypothetical protein [Oceanospirillaceae bacterium]|tara:strand:- start:1006 stop:1377 length:372 start_codon:yes stop_codon:yes gene_type:complete